VVAVLGGGVLLGAVAVAVARPNLVRNVLTSPRTLLTAAVVLVLVVGLGLLVRRLSGRAWAGGLAAAVPVAAVLALVVWPTFVPTTVDEPDPLADVVALAPGADGAAVAAVPSPPAGTPELRLDATPVPDGPTTATPPPAPVPAGPRALASAVLTGIDHDVTGTATLVDLGDGTSVVHLGAFDVEPGPDYQVHLVPGAGQERPDGVFLGALKGTRGDQSYTVPAGSPLDGPVTVLIWCRAFGVPVAAATLEL
jgi:hypothetical protein